MPKGALESEIARLASLYREEVLGTRTREIQLLGRKVDPEVLYTFLGFELKLGRKRITCPDMTTVRYLKIFGEVGAPSIQIPYDPTRTARLLPDLEASLARIKDLLRQEKRDRRRRQRRLREVYGRIRRQLTADS